jgi:Fe-Mn family superoxide dismutase
MKKSIFILSLALIFSVQAHAQSNKNSINQQKNTLMNTTEKINHEFKPLPYDYDALEPYIDKMTMEIHYSRHHKAYFDNFLKAINGTALENKELIDVFAEVSKYPAAVRNNGGGYFNHELFWDIMTPGGSKMSEGFEDLLIKRFGSMEKFKEDFFNAGMTRFGSGWVWLSVDENGGLFISSTPNQDNPLMDVTEKHGIPILGMDVWEHAYYLKYQNKRADYINAFWNVLNWKAVEERYQKAIKK